MSRPTPGPGVATSSHSHPQEEPLKIRLTAGVIATVAASALVLSACSSGDSSTGDASTPAESAGPSTGIVTANGSEPQNPLIPSNTNETGGGKILDEIFSGLVYYDADGAPHNEVAESIESDDNVTWTVKLKDGWTFTDGTPVQAHNFVDAWNYGALSTNAQLNGWWFSDIVGFDALQAVTDDAGNVVTEPTATEMTGLKVVDDLTFTIELTAPLSDYALRLGYAVYYPLPDSAFDDMAAFGENPIGNGPYKLETWNHNVEADLVPNPDYSGERVPQNGGVTLKFYTTLDAAYADLLAGQLDVLDALPDSAYGSFETDLGDRAVNQPAAIFQSFTIPQNLAHWSGEEGKLRRAALSHAIDRKTITDAIFEGTRTPASDFTSPVIDGWSDSVEGSDVLDYDPDMAKDLWAQADAISPWSGTFTIAYNVDGGHQGWVDAVTNSIRNVLGIEAEGQQYAVFADLRTDVKALKNGETSGLTGGFRTGWQFDYPGLYNVLAPLYATGASSNDGSYSNPDFDALLEKGAQAGSLDEANKYFQEAQTVLFQDLPAIPLWYSNVTGGSSENVSNVKFGWNSVPLYDEITKS